MKCFSTKLLVCMKGNKNNWYSRRMCFLFDTKQFDSLSFITGGGSFVLALTGEKRKINSKKDQIKIYITKLKVWMASSYISLQIIPEKGSLRIHCFISKHDGYLKPLGYVMGGWAFLDLSLILFIKSELHSRRFPPLCKSEFLFRKISDNRILPSSD